MSDNIHLTNLTGQPVTIVNFLINNTPVQLMQEGSGLMFSATYSDKNWDSFTGMILSIKSDSGTYNVDLNRDHYFNADNFRYPGAGSDVNYILEGTNNAASQVLLRLVYRQLAAPVYIYSGDSKMLDKKS